MVESTYLIIQIKVTKLGLLTTAPGLKVNLLLRAERKVITFRGPRELLSLTLIWRNRLKKISLTNKNVFILQ